MAYDYANQTAAAILNNLDLRMNSAEAIAAAAGISEGLESRRPITKAGERPGPRHSLLR